MSDTVLEQQQGKVVQQAEAGIAARLATHMARFPMPKDLTFLWTVGAMLIAVLALMVASGLSLALSYTPDATLAFSSVEALERRAPSGWLLRSLHMTGASFFMLALYCHLLRGLIYRSYAPPRRGVWGVGVAVLVMVMVTAFAGYVLPWGQMSYWGADVAGKAVGAVPLVGPTLEAMFLGGDAPGTPTLHRMFVLHFTMAFTLVAAVVLHVAVLHGRGSGSPSGLSGQNPKRMLSFHPYFTVKDVLGVVLMALAFTLVMCFWPGLVSEAENYRPANPLHTPADIEPAWYFLPFYGMLQVVPSKFGGLVVSAGAVLVLFLVPRLDPKPHAATSPWWVSRFVAGAALSVLVLSFIVVGLAGRHHVAGAWLTVGRLATLGFFAYFFGFLPWHARQVRPEAQL
ncbi:MAG: cytochrome b [Acetobacter cibinongensis]